MTSKQDRQGVRTPADLERKYNLGQSVSQSYVQSSIQSAVTAASNENHAYVDSKLQGIENYGEQIAELERKTDGVIAVAEQAEATAESAYAYAENASAEVANAQSTADTALVNASDALNAAEQAQMTADTANGTADNALLVANDAKNVADSAMHSATTALQAADDLQEEVEALRQDIEGMDVGGRNLLVNVEVDSLNTESLTADKTYAEIEEAILAEKNVRVKVTISDVVDCIYLHMAAHRLGSGIDFIGYYNRLPILLQIVPD